MQQLKMKLNNTCKTCLYNTINMNCNIKHTNKNKHKCSNWQPANEYVEELINEQRVEEITKFEKEFNKPQNAIQIMLNEFIDLVSDIIIKFIYIGIPAIIVVLIMSLSKYYLIK
jgi:hypothetical protein